MRHLSDDSLISRVEQLVADERYREGLHEIIKLRRDKREIGDQLRFGILESQCLTGLGEFTKAFKTAQDMVDLGANFQEHKMAVIEGLLEMASASWGLGQPDMILETCEEAENLRQELVVDDESLLESIRAEILHHESIGWYLNDDVHKGIEFALESLSINERMGDLPGIVGSHMRVGYLYFEVEPHQTLEYIERGLELNKQLGSNGHVIFGINCRAMVETDRGNWDEAEHLVQQGLSLAREHDHGRWMLFILYNIGHLYRLKGDFRSSEEAYLEHLTWAEKAGAEIHIALASGNLGAIYRARGDFDQALRCYERQMEIFKRIGRIKDYLGGLASCGRIHYAMGFPDKALVLLEESLTLAEVQEQNGLLGGGIRAYNILQIIMILVDEGLVDEAQQRLEQIRLISEETKSTDDERAYRVATALVLKSSMLPRKMVEAKEHLVEVIDGSFLHYEISALTLLILSELLVNELQMTGDQEVLESLNVRLTKLSEMANEQESTLLLVETLLLQSKVALLQLEADKANRLLNQAQSLASQKGLRNISKRVIDEHDVLLNELSIWEKLGEDKPPMEERTDKVGIHEQIGEMIRQGIWRKMLF